MNDYPTDEQLETIKNWKADDFVGLMKYVRFLWNYADVGYWVEIEGEYRISTAGWSGNEDIIFAMKQNHIWWMMFWYQSQRGGHYIFKGR